MSNKKTDAQYQATQTLNNNLVYSLHLAEQEDKKNLTKIQDALTEARSQQKK